MATAIPNNSVWSAMTYTPPRGRCNFKTSLMSPACPCLRFMLHPAATSFECDGCNHHASFHSLENPTEDAVLKKWAQQEEGERERQAIEGASRKRRRVVQKPVEEERVLAIMDVPGGMPEEDSDAQSTAVTVQVPVRKKKGRKAAS